jgi:hypothetical protein
VAVLLAAAFAATLRPGRALPLADARLAGPALRTAALRVSLGIALAALVATAALAGRGRPSTAEGLLRTGSTTVVVLDMSASVSDLVYAEIARTLGALQEAAGRSSPPATVGLVLFSDVAQEALPPGTPARELGPFRRFFLPRQERSTRPRPSYYRPAGPAAPAPTQYPLSPWFAGFSAGTTISAGLALAREALERDRISRGHVLLVSDLADRPEDLPALARELVAYARSGISLDVVALPPAYEAQKELFRRFLDRGAAVVDSSGVTATPSSGPGAPAALVAAAVLAALALGYLQLHAVPLRWGHAGGGER